MGVSYSQISADSLASKLLEVTKSKDAYENTIALMLIDHNSIYGKDSDLLTDFIWKHFNYDSIKCYYIDLYTEEFTASELQQLIDFYATDIGKKIVNRTSILIAKSLRFSTEIFQQKLPMLDSLLMEEYLTFLRDTSTVFTEDFESLKFFEEIDIDTLQFNNLNYDDCEKFKVGKYLIKDDESDFYCIREKDYQHEISEFLNVDTEYKVEWLSGCEYNLIFVKNSNKKFAFYKQGDIINIKIIATRDTEYDCIVNYNNSRRMVTMIKIN